MKRTFDTTDPLTLAMAPPPNETLDERLAREEREERAREVSKRIDAEIKLAKAAMKKRQKAIKVLVLGQSLSGMFCSFPRSVCANCLEVNQQQLKVCAKSIFSTAHPNIYPCFRFPDDLRTPLLG